MNLGERGPTRKMKLKDAKTLLEIESKFVDMVKKNEARIQVGKDKAGNIIYKFFKNDGTSLGFVDEENFAQLKQRYNL